MPPFRMTRETLDSSSWFLRDEYPFASHFLELPAGGMHYLDEGRGPPVLFVHGTPSWSFEHRKVIARLREHHRCIAPDHLGFGLSDRPEGRGPTLPEHAQNLAGFVDRLAPGPLDLVVHDFGGPIALPLLADHEIRSVTILNSWFWPFETVDPSFEKKKRWLDSGLMRFLYLHANFSARVMVKMSWGKRQALDRRHHLQYLRMFPSAESRQGPWALAQAMVHGSPHFERHADVLRLLRSRPALLIWGKADRFVDGPHLARWRELVPEARVVELADVGHFPQEEAADDVAQAIASLLASR